MSHLDIEITQLKAETIKMWELVNIQLKKGREALINLDKDLAREIVLKERRVNAYELKLDRDCENIFALFNPVAIDLRFVLAVLKINNNLERTPTFRSKFCEHEDEIVVEVRVLIQLFQFL